MAEPVLTIRPATSADIDKVEWTLYAALSWDPDDPIPSRDEVLAHPKIAVYFEGWMRPGDAGVVAEEAGRFAGMAYCRTFPETGVSQGFYDTETPELAIAVRPEFRGRGIGSQLIAALSTILRNAGVARMSLSVAEGNPARRLYERLGYRVVRREERAVVMVADVPEIAAGRRP